METIKRGLVAAEKGNGYFLSWRLLGSEAYETGFNIYRGDQKLNDAPITGSTNYFDEAAEGFENYSVRAVIDGEEQPSSEFARLLPYSEGENAAFFDLPLNRPPRGEHGGSYSPNDLSVGDLTGNGEYEIIVKWDPSNSKDNSQSGTTDNVLLDAYTLGGEMLWRIDLGPNIRAGAHYTQFMVYDFDGNGKAELMVKTAPGTRDGNGDFISQGPAANTDHSEIYRNSRGYILYGPEYLSVFEGATGKEIDTENYIPARGNVSDWGDSYGNRVDRFLAGVAYLDGQKPSAIFARGYYSRMTVASWDFTDGELVNRWLFDTDDPEYGSEWTSQGNHQLSIIDADNDEKQEVIYGSVVIDDDGTGLHTTGLGHGDALHATFMEKNAEVPYIFMPHEEDEPGVSLRRADDGTMLFRKDKSGDVGRGVAAHLDVDYLGFQFWASSDLGLYNTSGDRIGSIPNSINHVIWWDGELSRELLNESTVTKWDINGGRAEELFRASSGSSINGTKANPNLQADLFGDWREEVIFRSWNHQTLRIYTTTMPTDHRLYTFMHDPTYRVAVAWQNSGYNQPPHPGFYVAGDMDFPLTQPDIRLVSSNVSSCSAADLTPAMAIGDSGFENRAYVSVENRATVRLQASAEQEGTWHWSGPQNYQNTSQEITIENLNKEKSGYYTATFTNQCGTTNRITFLISVLDSSWGFEDDSYQGWIIDEDLGFLSLSKSTKFEGYFSLNLQGSYSSDSVALHYLDPQQNSAIEVGDWLNFRVLVPDSEADDITELVIFHQHGSSFESEDVVTERVAFPIENIELEEWITLSAQLADSFNSNNLLAMGILLRQKPSSNPEIFIDDIHYSETMPISNEPNTVEVPNTITLGANYPNPFNPTTQIPFNLDKSEQVTIQIYDISGRKVRDIVENKPFSAGSHTATFSAEGLSSGIYFYQMSAGNFHKTRIMNLIK